MSRISTGFFAACCLAGAGTLTAAPVPAKPSAFHIVSVAFSDSLAFYYRILDVQPDGESGSFVTYSHIGPMDSVCQRPKIQSANKRVPDRTPPISQPRQTPAPFLQDNSNRQSTAIADKKASLKR